MTASHFLSLHLAGPNQHYLSPIFCNSILTGLPALALTLSQSIFNRAARGNLLMCKSDHFSYLYKIFQIIHLSLRIKSQIIRMVCKAVQIRFYLPPIHLCFHLSPLQPCRPSCCSLQKLLQQLFSLPEMLLCYLSAWPKPSPPLSLCSSVTFSVGPL